MNTVVVIDGEAVPSVVLVDEDPTFPGVLSDVAIGPPGPPGPVGPPGPAGVSLVQFSQDIPATTWSIPHALDHTPAVTFWDSTNREIVLAVAHTPGLVTATADLPVAGRAMLI